MPDLTDIIYRLVKSMYKDVEKAFVGLGNYKHHPMITTRSLLMPGAIKGTQRERRSCRGSTGVKEGVASL